MHLQLCLSGSFLYPIYFSIYLCGLVPCSAINSPESMWIILSPCFLSCPSCLCYVICDAFIVPVSVCFSLSLSLSLFLSLSLCSLTLVAASHLILSHLITLMFSFSFSGIVSKHQWISQSASILCITISLPVHSPAPCVPRLSLSLWSYIIVVKSFFIYLRSFTFIHIDIDSSTSSRTVSSPPRATGLVSVSCILCFPCCPSLKHLLSVIIWVGPSSVSFQDQASFLHLNFFLPFWF